MKALSKALQIFEEFGRATGPLGVSDISDALGFNRSMVSKTLSTFKKQGFLKQDKSTRKYSPDVKCFLLGSSYINQAAIIQQTAVYLRKLADQTGHISMLCRLYGTEVLEIAVTEGREFFDARLKRGSLMPCHATATGQVILAFLPDEERKSLFDGLELAAFTDKTIVDKESLEKRLGDVRKSGYSVTRGESFPGLGAIAAPVFGYGDGQTYSICVAFPDAAVDEAEEARLIGVLHSYARSLSLAAGATVYPYGNGHDD